MFCVSCGKRLEPGMKFCPACGAVADWSTQTSAQTGSASDAAGQTQTPPPPPPPQGRAASTRLVRPREGRIIAGVCAAFALQYGWDVTIVRVLTVVIAFFTVVGFIAYLIAWLVIPEAPYALPSASR